MRAAVPTLAFAIMSLFLAASVSGASAQGADTDPPGVTVLTVTVADNVEGTFMDRSGGRAHWANAGDRITIDVTFDEDVATSPAPTIVVPGAHRTPTAVDMVNTADGNDRSWSHTFTIDAADTGGFTLTFTIVATDTATAPNTSPTSGADLINWQDITSGNTASVLVRANVLSSAEFTGPMTILMKFVDTIAADTVTTSNLGVTAPDNTLTPHDADTMPDEITVSGVNRLTARNIEATLSANAIPGVVYTIAPTFANGPGTPFDPTTCGATCELTYTAPLVLSSAEFTGSKTIRMTFDDTIDMSTVTTSNLGVTAPDNTLTPHDADTLPDVITVSSVARTTAMIVTATLSANAIHGVAYTIAPTFENSAGTPFDPATCGATCTLTHMSPFDRVEKIGEGFYKVVLRSAATGSTIRASEFTIINLPDSTREIPVTELGNPFTPPRGPTETLTERQDFDLRVASSDVLGPDETPTIRYTSPATGGLVFGGTDLGAGVWEIVALDKVGIGTISASVSRDGTTVSARFNAPVTILPDSVIKVYTERLSRGSVAGSVGGSNLMVSPTNPNEVVGTLPQRLKSAEYYPEATQFGDGATPPNRSSGSGGISLVDSPAPEISVALSTGDRTTVVRLDEAVSGTLRAADWSLQGTTSDGPVTLEIQSVRAGEHSTVDLLRSPTVELDSATAFTLRHASMLDAKLTSLPGILFREPATLPAGQTALADSGGDTMDSDPFTLDELMPVDRIDMIPPPKTVVDGTPMTLVSATLDSPTQVSATLSKSVDTNIALTGSEWTIGGGITFDTGVVIANTITLTRTQALDFTHLGAGTALLYTGSDTASNRVVDASGLVVLRTGSSVPLTDGIGPTASASFGTSSVIKVTFSEELASPETIAGLTYTASKKPSTNDFGVLGPTETVTLSGSHEYNPATRTLELMLTDPALRYDEYTVTLPSSGLADTSGNALTATSVVTRAPPFTAVTNSPTSTTVSFFGAPSDILNVGQWVVTDDDDGDSMTSEDRQVTTIVLGTKSASRLHGQALIAALGTNTATEMTITHAPLSSTGSTPAVRHNISIGFVANPLGLNVPHFTAESVDAVRPTYTAKTVSRTETDVSFSEAVVLPAVGSRAAGWTVGGFGASAAGSQLNGALTLTHPDTGSTAAMPVVAYTVPTGDSAPPGIVDLADKTLNAMPAPQATDGTPPAPVASFSADNMITVNFGESMANAETIAGLAYTVTMPDGSDDGDAPDTVPQTTGSPTYDTGTNTLTITLASNAVNGIEHTVILPSTGLADAQGNAVTERSVSAANGDAPPAVFTARTLDSDSIAVTFPSRPTGTLDADDWTVSEDGTDRMVMAVTSAIGIFEDMEVLARSYVLTHVGLASTASTPKVTYSSASGDLYYGSTPVPTGQAVAADTAPPEIRAAVISLQTSLHVTFTEPVTFVENTEGTSSPYVAAIEGTDNDWVVEQEGSISVTPVGIQVLSAVRSSPLTYTLTLGSPIVAGTEYTVIPDYDIADMAEPANAVGAEESSMITPADSFTAETQTLTTTRVTFDGSLGGTLDTRNWTVTENDAASDAGNVALTTLSVATVVTSGTVTATPETSAGAGDAVTPSIPSSPAVTELLITHGPLSSTAATPSVMYVAGTLTDGVNAVLSYSTEASDGAPPELAAGNSLHMTKKEMGTFKMDLAAPARLNDNVWVNVTVTEPLYVGNTLIPLYNDNTNNNVAALGDAMFFTDSASPVTASHMFRPHNSAPLQYNYSHTVTASSPEVDVTFSITVRDAEGNAATFTHADLTTRATNADGSSIAGAGYRVSIDRTPPTMLTDADTGTTSATTLTVKLSENLPRSATVGSADWGVAEGTTAVTVTSAALNSARDRVDIAYADADVDTSFAPTVTYMGTGLSDGAGNPLATGSSVIVPDRLVPSIDTVTFTSHTTVHVTFTEDVVLPATTAGWGITPDLGVASLTQPGSDHFVRMTLRDDATVGETYVIRVGQVTDKAMVPNSLAANMMVTQEYVEVIPPAAYTATTHRAADSTYVRIVFTSMVTGNINLDEWFVGTARDGTGGTQASAFSVVCTSGGAPTVVSTPPFDITSICSGTDTEPLTFYIGYDAQASDATPHIAYRPVSGQTMPVLLASDGTPIAGRTTAIDGLPPLFTAKTVSPRSIEVTFDEDVTAAAGGPDASRWYHYATTTTPPALPTATELAAAVTAGTNFGTAELVGRTLTLTLAESTVIASGWGTGDTTITPPALGYDVPASMMPDILDASTAPNGLAANTATNDIADDAPLSAYPLTLTVANEASGSFTDRTGPNSQHANVGDRITLDVTFSEDIVTSPAPMITVPGTHRTSAPTAMGNNGDTDDRTWSHSFVVDAADDNAPLEFAIRATGANPATDVELTQSHITSGGNAVIDTVPPELLHVLRPPGNTHQLTIYTEPVHGTAAEILSVGPDTAEFFGPRHTFEPNIPADAPVHTIRQTHQRVLNGPFTLSITGLFDRADNPLVPVSSIPAPLVETGGTITVPELFTVPATGTYTIKALGERGELGESTTIVLSELPSDTLAGTITVNVDGATVTLPQATVVEDFGDDDADESVVVVRLPPPARDTEYVAATGADEEETAANEAVTRVLASRPPATLVEFGKSGDAAPMTFDRPVAIRLLGAGAAVHAFWLSGADGLTVHSIPECESRDASEVPGEIGSGAIRLEECRVRDGGDLVIWTNHFTRFGATQAGVSGGGGDGCDDCTPPTLGVDSTGTRRVSQGFSYNGETVDAEYYYTPMPLITVETGVENVAIIKVFEDTGPLNVRHVGLAFGLGRGQHFGESSAEIRVSLPYGNGNATASVGGAVDTIDAETLRASSEIGACMAGSDAECRIVTIHHTFREPLDFDVVSTVVWDERRNSWQNFFNHGVHVTGESLNPSHGIEVNDGTLVLYPLIASNVDADGDGTYDYDTRHVTYMLDDEYRVYRITPAGTYEPLRNLASLYHEIDESMYDEERATQHGWARGTDSFAELIAYERAIAREHLHAMGVVPTAPAAAPAHVVSSEPEDQQVYLDRLRAKIAHEINLAELELLEMYPAPPPE